MVLFQFLLLIVLLAASLGPGLWMVRNLRWSPAERLGAAVAASGVTLYLTSGLIYALHLPRFSFFAVSAGCLALGLAAGRRGWALLVGREVRWALGAFAFLVFWTLLFLLMVRTYSGANWCIDWIEHYQRTLFFLEHQPADTRFVGMYALPARPPFMNLVAGHFLAQAGLRFDLFQVVCAVLNLLPFLSCWLIIRHMVPRAAGRSGRTILLCLFAASPFLIENAGYTVTKGLTNACVILGLAFYLRAWRRADPLRMAAAGAILAAGVLVHYSAAPYLIPLVVHYLVFVLPRLSRAARRPALLAALPGLLLLATWIGWSLGVYGPGITFGSNTTAEAAASMSAGQNVRKVALNLFYTIVPHPLRLGPGEFLRAVYQPSAWGLARDYYFTMVQTGLVLGMGLVGGFVVLGRLARLASAPRLGTRLFWLGFVLTATLLTVATHPTEDVFGVAHVCSQPLLLLGVTFLAASFPALPPGLRLAVAAGCAFDFLAGILVHFSLQHWIPGSDAGTGRNALILSQDLLTQTALLNLDGKRQLGATFLGDHLPRLLPWLQVTALILFGFLLLRLVRIALASRPAAPAGRLATWTLPVLTLTAGGFCLVSTRPTGERILPQPAGVEVSVRAAEQDFDSSGPRVNLGLALYQAGNIEGAMEQWAEALLLQPDNPAARYYTRLVVLQPGVRLPPPVAIAESVFQKPRSAEARAALSDELWARRHALPAVAAMEEALRLDPNLADGYARLGRMNLDLGRYAECIRALEIALRLQPSPDLHYGMALALINSEQPGAAAGHLREALRLNPNFAPAQQVLRQITSGGLPPVR